ncbi:MAG: xanthine dehydrogenase small subunit [Rubrivivax sp.]
MTSEIRPIRFIHRGRVQQVSGVAPTRTVLEWLREDARCTGTKEGCAEGDCGACTVIVGEADAAAPGGVALKTVNACIQFLPTLDGRALLTVEDLGGPHAPHPAQQAMVDGHGSQCGFCTPGFVMCLAAVHEDHSTRGTRPDRAALCDVLAGNLCRCTGYRPIVEAGLAMFEDPTPRVNRAALLPLLQTLAADPPLHYAAPNPAAGGRVDHFHAPRDIDGFARLRLEHPEARLLAGSTDIGLWVTKQFRDLGDVLWIGAVQALRGIAWRSGDIDAAGPMQAEASVGAADSDRVVVTDGSSRWLEVGAGASLQDAWAALARHWPELAEVGLRFAGPSVRHAGTLGGNLANGSPIGDGAPVLMAMDARLVLRRGGHRRVLRLDDFCLDYMKNRLEPGEFLEAVRVPDLDTAAAGGSAATHHLRAWKISKRFDCDISALCAGIRLSLVDGRVEDVRLAFGGMAATVRRAQAAEAALRGQSWTEQAVQAACAALDADFTPLTDLRASAGYRRDAARGLLHRLWLQTRPHDPLPLRATTVWAQEVSA